MKALLPSIVAAALLVAAPGHAHITLTSPTPRYPNTFQKYPPCAKGAQDARTTNVTRFRPGETITVSWIEHVLHNSNIADNRLGFFRISFDPDGVDDFTIPPPDETNLPHKYPRPKDPPYTLPILLDVKDDDNARRNFSVQVTLPNVSCQNCTLQLLQMMADKPPYDPNTPGAALYFQCADLVLEGAPVEDGGVMPARDLGTLADMTAPGSDGSAAGPAGPGMDPGCQCQLGRGHAPQGMALPAALLLGAWLHAVLSARRRLLVRSR